MKKLISITLAAGSLLAVWGSQAWAWDGRYEGWHRDRWHYRPYQHSSVVVIYREPRPVPYSYADGCSNGARVGFMGDNTVVVNIPNENGSYTPVTLRRSGGVYIGPRGEQYLNLPTIEQLKPVYGLK